MRKMTRTLIAAAAAIAFLTVGASAAMACPGFKKSKAKEGVAATETKSDDKQASDDSASEEAKSESEVPADSEKLAADTESSGAGQ